jgi:hypothetical protein
LRRECGGLGAGGEENTPLLNKEGELVVDQKGKEELWADHFGGLAKDVTGNSRDASHWVEVIPGVGDKVLDGCEDPLRWEEVRQAIKDSKRGKAAGIDKIPGELFKLVENEEGEPTSRLGKAIWRTIHGMWTKAKVPKCWDTAVVVPVPKKGDRRNPDNYRGISLIPVAVKILSKVVARRVSAIAEENGLLAKEQAGFRDREECVGQTIALYEVILRRSNQGRDTFGLFIDFAKAYDKVPHEGLLRKLRSVGIGGKVHEVITALYRRPRMCVRTGTGLSGKVDYQCGVRQGCPISPILFDIYINDLLVGMVGVEVPGLDENVPGLLFADDAVIFAESREDLRRSARLVEAWALKWEMQVNAGKCGEIRFRGHQTNDEPDPKRRPVPSEPITMGDEAVPLVDHYVYLGTMMDEMVSRTRMVAHNATRGMKALMSISPFLHRSEIPTYIKRLIIKAKLVPILTFGAELWGMNTSLCTRLQSIVDSACRSMVKGGASTCLHRMRTELKVPTVSQLAAEKRARAWGKYPSLRTWIATLISRPKVCRRATWVSGTSRWMKTYLEIGEGDSVKRRVLNTFTRREEKRDRSKVSAWVRALSLDNTTPWVRLGMTYPELAGGLLAIGRLRMGIFPFAGRLAKAGLLSSNLRGFCPSCPLEVPENVEHIVLTCPGYETVRQQYIWPEIPGWERMVRSPAARTEAVSVLLGGELKGHMDVWVFGTAPMGAATINSWMRSVKGTNLVLALARFLDRVVPLRMAKLGRDPAWRRRVSSRNQGPTGMVALGEL